MNWVNATRDGLTILVIAACAYDVVIAYAVGDKATISAWFHGYRNFPTAWLCVGYLICHFIGLKESGTVYATEYPKSALRVFWEKFGWQAAIGISAALAFVVAAVLVQKYRGK
jgi:hypothetical protein